MVAEAGRQVDQRRARIADNQLRQVGNLEKIRGKAMSRPAACRIFEFLSTMTDKDTTVQTWKTANFVDGAGQKVTVYYP